MKEFNISLSNNLFKGLRKFSNNPRSNEAPIECHNLAPAENGLELHEYITSMNEAAAFEGRGTESASNMTRTISINVNDFVTLADLQTVFVYIDEILKGETDINGDITIADVTVGSHALRMTKVDYIDSDADTLLNDFIRVI